MRLGVLFSGGKDSTLALHLAAEKEEVICLITVVSKNPESYMFHTPNIDVTALAGRGVGVAAGFSGYGGAEGRGTCRLGGGNCRGKAQIPNRRYCHGCCGVGLPSLAGSTHLQPPGRLVLQPIVEI